MTNAGPACASPRMGVAGWRQGVLALFAGFAPALAAVRGARRPAPAIP